MSKRDSRIDDYIAKSADFAKPILTHLRALVHEVCPDVEETMKWSHPNFLYKGMFCGMASFKEHCAFGFWKESLIVKDGRAETGAFFGSLGKLTSVASLPSKKVMTGYLKTAMKLNDDGVKSPAREKKAPRQLIVPDDLSARLKTNKKARETFERFSPSNKREYVEWINDAKTEATRLKRLETTIEWLAEGKTRNWKYMNC
jgi:uncharacterized protein YdeI (YjbR/CyaY-like superfamily)